MGELDYVLRQEWNAHERKGGRCASFLTKRDGDHAGARVLATGGYDGTVALWEMDENAESRNKFREAQRHTIHTGTVYCIADAHSLQPDTAGPSFVSGGRDTLIHWVDGRDGKLLKTYKGHSGPVCSIKVVPCSESDSQGNSPSSSRPLVLSGSWDASARLWDFVTTECLCTLSNSFHAHAVSVAWWRVKGSELPMVATASQNCQLHLWRPLTSFPSHKMSPAPEHTIDAYHSDIVRSLEIIDQRLLLSCGNDGVVQVYDLVRQKTVWRANVSSTFLFGAAMAITERGPIVCAVGEDQLLRILRFDTSASGCSMPTEVACSTADQRLNLGSTGWNVCFIPTMEGAVGDPDIATIAEDGWVSLWTPRGSGREGAAAEQEAREKRLAGKSEKAPEAAQPFDIARLVPVSQLNSVRGKAVGENKLFRDGELAVVYSWTGTMWEKIGEATSSVDSFGQFYEGDGVFPRGNYDYLFRAEVGDDGTQKIIPYRVGDNALETAEKFLAREQLSKEYIPQIVEFIQQNAVRSGSDGQARKEQKQGEQGTVDKTVTAFQLPEVVTFRKTQVEKLSQKLLEFNESQADASLRLSELEVTYFRDLVTKLENPTLSSVELRQCELDLVFHGPLAKWSEDKLLPVIDLWRVVALTASAPGVHKGAAGGWPLIKQALHWASAPNSEGVAICAVRYLCNLFVHQSIIAIILRFRHEFVTRMPSDWQFISQRRSQNYQVALSALVLNLCIARRESQLAESQRESTLRAGADDADDKVARYVVELWTALSSPTNENTSAAKGTGPSHDAMITFRCMASLRLLLPVLSAASVKDLSSVLEPRLMKPHTDPDLDQLRKDLLENVWMLS